MPETSNYEAAMKGISDERPLIDTFPNQFPEGNYLHEIRVGEYTSVCPKTGMPDFGVVRIRYIADKLCMELKSLKYYFYSFRDRGIFYENLINVVIEDIVSVCSPRFLEVIVDMSPRGGISSRLVRQHFGVSSVAVGDKLHLLLDALD